MSKSDNTFFRILDIFAHFVLLNTLWVILCIPVITIFPATTALFSVVRKWVTEGTDAGVIQLFFTSFKENFKKSFIIGLFWLIAGLILYFDLSLLLQIEFTGKLFVYILLSFSAILYVFLSIYVFFVMVQYELSIVHTLKNALILSVSHLLHTLLFLVIIAAALITAYYFKMFMIIFGSTVAFVLYYIFHRLDAAIIVKKSSY
ncbi:YesL family protein [Lederbergia galactosidilytica]|uniref:DUF624 domain-containing protein n=1 Tax=Lederbergia galactosidilytica TaxID=217031 RepID=A0A178A5T8_9BACI|nr:DUF624 domain-containing protein [Lederbergia galactosidilytica]OAK75492.1 hypothetical protein ABB05_01950 [Lederbergia galactosidilytica]